MKKAISTALSFMLFFSIVPEVISPPKNVALLAIAMNKIVYIKLTPIPDGGIFIFHRTKP